MYTEEIFVIRDRFVSQGIPFYKLKDMMDNPIQGTFYASECPKTNRPFGGSTRYCASAKCVEKMVRWLGWPKKFDSWIPKRDIKET
jgi:hypothetical protein